MNPWEILGWILVLGVGYVVLAVVLGIASLVVSAIIENIKNKKKDRK